MNHDDNDDDASHDDADATVDYTPTFVGSIYRHPNEPPSQPKTRKRKRSSSSSSKRLGAKKKKTSSTIAPCGLHLGNQSTYLCPCAKSAGPNTLFNHMIKYTKLNQELDAFFVSSIQRRDDTDEYDNQLLARKAPNMTNECLSCSLLMRCFAILTLGVRQPHYATIEKKDDVASLGTSKSETEAETTKVNLDNCCPLGFGGTKTTIVSLEEDIVPRADADTGRRGIRTNPHVHQHVVSRDRGCHQNKRLSSNSKPLTTLTNNYKEETTVWSSNKYYRIWKADFYIGEFAKYTNGNKRPGKACEKGDCSGIRFLLPLVSNWLNLFIEKRFYFLTTSRILEVDRNVNLLGVHAQFITDSSKENDHTCPGCGVNMEAHEKDEDHLFSCRLFLTLRIHLQFYLLKRLLDIFVFIPPSDGGSTITRDLYKSKLESYWVYCTETLFPLPIDPTVRPHYVGNILTTTTTTTTTTQ